MSMNDGRRLSVPTPPKGEEIATFSTYLEAQKAVDVLADSAFAVQAVTIVGSDLRMVERVTGRLSYPRVAIAGALSGVWFGLFIGLLFSLFSEYGLATILVCVVLGAAFGMLFGVISYAFTGGKRDFVSQSQVVASRYDVLCLSEVAAEARNRLQAGGIRTVARGAVRPQPTTTTWGAAPEGPSAPGCPGAPGTPGGSPLPGWPVAPSDDTPPGEPASRPTPPEALEPPRYGQRLDDPPQQ